MSAKQTTIVINGRVYDAISGLPLKTAVNNSTIVPQAPKTTPIQVHTTPHSPPKHKPAERQIHHKAAKATSIHVRTKSAQTLMRTGVKKPHSQHIKATSSIAYTIPVHNKPRAHSVAPDKLARAQAVSKSAVISKFGTHGLAKVIKKQGSISVKSAPVVPQSTHQTQAAQHTPKASTNHAATERILHNALVNASTHQAPKLSLKPKRSVNALAIVAIVVILSGFIGVQNSAKISYAMAAKQAGVAMQLPGTAPAGFSLSNAIDYSHGLVSFRYLSHNDDRWIQVDQQLSAYKNSSELEATLSQNTNDYQRIEKGGITIFVAGNKSASWIKDGNLFTLTGNTDLSTDQITRLAALR